MRDPKLAAILSLLIPGVGQLYNGRVLGPMIGTRASVPIGATCYGSRVLARIPVLV